MARFNIPIDQNYSSSAASRIVNERRIRRSVATVGVNDKGLRPNPISRGLLKIATSLSMLTASAVAFLAWRLD